MLLRRNSFTSGGIAHHKDTKNRRTRSVALLPGGDGLPHVSLASNSIQVIVSNFYLCLYLEYEITCDVFPIVFREFIPPLHPSQSRENQGREKFCRGGAGRVACVLLRCRRKSSVSISLSFQSLQCILLMMIDRLFVGDFNKKVAPRRKRSNKFMPWSTS